MKYNSGNLNLTAQYWDVRGLYEPAIKLMTVQMTELII